MNAFYGILSAVVLMGATAGTASAAGKTWMGKDADGYRYVYSNTGGSSWTESVNGTLRGKCTEVARTADYIELQMDGVPSERTRLYGSEFYFWSEKHGCWIRMGTGRWTD